MDDRKNDLEIAAMMFENLGKIPLHIQADTFTYIEARLRDDDYQKCLGISRDDFVRRKRAAFIAEGKHTLGGIRSHRYAGRDHVYYIKRLTTNIVCNEFSLEEIDLSPEEFKIYAEEAAAIVAKEAVEQARLSQSAISAIAKVAGFDLEARARIAKVMRTVANYSEIE